MKKLIFLAILLPLLSSCTQNDGHIGHLFGFWQIESIEVDGDPEPGYGQNLFVSFQNDIVMFQTMYTDVHEWAEYYGTFKEQDDGISLNFTYKMDGMESGTGVYSLPPQLHLKAPGEYLLRYVENGSKNMTLQTVNAEGQTLRYVLKKVY